MRKRLYPKLLFLNPGLSLRMANSPPPPHSDRLEINDLDNVTSGSCPAGSSNLGAQITTLSNLMKKLVDLSSKHGKRPEDLMVFHFMGHEGVIDNKFHFCG
ncbi:hypothetical protein K490DRAFT_57427 [Saccharata proteae CBS 121410]|uniref:Uncharacterized protein n=1 Tax=Saccharata proteae CBS 121410 TaxID=1314787 RepID=A0A9P4HU92_9PEZI|nr:hypothetical protein K490DRAFT_57427 [Saccharata proteae CBS 121410]